MRLTDDLVERVAQRAEGNAFFAEELAVAADDRGGSDPADLARLTIHTTDVAAYRAHAPELGRVWRESAGRDYPAMALIGVVRLWDENALVELDGIAVLP